MPAAGPADPVAAKVELRRALAAARRRVSPDARRAAGGAAAAHLVATAEFARARRVALYAALPDELPTRPLFARARLAGKRVLLPRVDDGLAFREVGCWEELRPGRYGVSEPPPGEPVRLGADTLVVVPGVAFDAAGGRLGRGGGYYDRAFPAGLAAAPTLFGYGYALQLVDAVPMGPGDRRLDAVVTERGVVRAEGRT